MRKVIKQEKSHLSPSPGSEIIWVEAVMRVYGSLVHVEELCTPKAYA